MKNLLLGLFLFLSMTDTILAQDYPVKPVKIVMGLPVGSAPDTVIRRVAIQLNKQWNVPVIVENRPGASGIVGLDYFVKEPADGHTIYFADWSQFIHGPIFHQRLDLLDKITPVTGVYTTPVVIVGPKNKNTKAALIESLKSKPYFGSWGIGSWGHLCGTEIATALNSSVTHVPYREFGPWFTDIANNELSFGCTSFGSSESYEKGHRISFIAVATNTRDPAFPDVPTIKEALGFGIDTQRAWLATYVHSNTNPQLVQKISNDIRSALQDSQVRATIAQVHGRPWLVSTQEFTQIYTQDFARVKQLFDRYQINRSK
jgi:tripartite-type tricarboxylate transporter receptor subunit TctC